MTGGSVAAVADGYSLDSVPCIVPLLPLVVGTAGAAHRAGPLLLAAGVALSLTTIGLFVATVGFTIGLDGDISVRLLPSY